MFWYMFSMAELIVLSFVGGAFLTRRTTARNFARLTAKTRENNTSVRAARFMDSKFKKRNAVNRRTAGHKTVYYELPSIDFCLAAGWALMAFVIRVAYANGRFVVSEPADVAVAILVALATGAFCAAAIYEGALTAALEAGNRHARVGSCVRICAADTPKEMRQRATAWLKRLIAAARA